MKRLLAVCCVLAMLIAVMSVMPTTASALVKGDLNDDGRVDTLDVRLIMRKALANDTNKTILFRGDMDLNSQLQTADARELMRQVLRADSSEVEVGSYALPADYDCFGERSISLVGDSISAGAGANDPLPNSSYASYVRKAVQKANNGQMNYGFTSSQAWVGSSNFEAYEIHKVQSSTNWERVEQPETYLFSSAYTSSTAGATLTYYLRTDFKDSYTYFRVYYQEQPNGGNFVVSKGDGTDVPNVNGSKAYIQTAGTTSVTRRTELYRLSDCAKDSSGRPLIHIYNGTSKPVTITGIGYYKRSSLDTTTVNSYTLSGESLCDVGNQVLDQAASADTMIFALGYNDVYWNTSNVNNGVFKQKIDHLIEVCKQNNTKVIVSDHVWNNPQASADSAKLNTTAKETAYNTVKSELRRFAKETNGMYIDQQTVNGSAAMLATLNGTYESGNKGNGDGVHPNAAGHKLIAKNIVAAMGLEWTESWT